jgi:hypothetical protein
MALVAAFADAHHVDEVFVKRRRKDAKGRDEAFSRQPPVERPRAKQTGPARRGED